jgi:RHS repeat-associated protein
MRTDRSRATVPTPTPGIRAGISEAISGGATASFVYDALGRRMSKTIGGTTTQFLYDRLNPVQEFNGANPPAATANLLTGLGIDEYFARTASGTTSTLLTDALGSTIGLVGSSSNIATSYTYQPFGATTAGGASNTNPYQFTGRENDGTGLYFYRARYYSPTYQRFVAQDPIGFAGGDPNLYGYVYDDPVNLIDPPGLWGFGGSASGTGEIGVGVAGAGGTVAAGFGGFFNGLSFSSLGGFFTAAASPVAQVGASLPHRVRATKMEY